MCDALVRGYGATPRKRLAEARRQTVSAAEQTASQAKGNFEMIANHLASLPSSNSISSSSRPMATAPSKVTCRDDLPLYDEEDIPEWQKGNPFILSYYRCGYSTMQCFKSVFAVHNETGNIWIHLLGFVVVLVLSVHILVDFGLNRLEDYAVFFFFELGSMVMLGGSSLYHTLSGHECERVHNGALALDYFGITFMIVGSFYPPVYYLFSCLKAVRATYLAAVTSVGVLGLVGPFFSFYNSPAFYWPRLILYLTLSAVGALPAMHIIFGMPINDMSQPVYQGMAIMVLTYLAGMIIYIFKIPERWFPGAFDVALHSHQLWHIFVLAAAVIHYFTCMAAFQLWRVTGPEGGECA